MSDPKNFCAQENCAALQALTERVAWLMDVRQDVKSVLSSVQKIQLQLAVVPTFEHLKPLTDDIQSLKDSRQRVVGGWKTITFLGSLVGCLGGAIGGLITWIFTRVPALSHA